MKTRCIKLIIACIATVIGAQAQISWPHGKRAAIVLTYDDGLKSQRQYVMPQLEAKNFRGTFFLYGQVVSQTDIPEWREAAKRGHELGNHSLFHPCLAGTTDNTSSPCRSLECYSVKDLLIEIGMMDNFLYAIDGKTQHAYAYPCGQAVAGGEDYSQPLLKSGLTKYCRGAARGISNDAKRLNFAMIPTLPAMTGCKANELIDYVKEAVQKEGLAVIVFHGVGGDYLTVDATEHQKLVDYLSQHSDELWIGTFSEVLDYVAEQAKK